MNKIGGYPNIQISIGKQGKNHNIQNPLVKQGEKIRIRVQF